MRTLKVSTGRKGNWEIRRERERERGRGVGLEVIRPRSSRLYLKEDLIPVFGLSRGERQTW